MQLGPDWLTTALSFIVTLGVLIFIHELGHFLVAKWVGIRVDRFSLGFPPHIFSKTRGETTYSIGIIPLGGYVKMAGENPDEEPSGAPYEFMSKPVWQRALVIFAGPFMNYVLAIALVAGLLFLKGEAQVDPDRAMVGEVEPETPAALAGLIEGDQIIAVNGEEVTSFSTLTEKVYPHPEEEITLTWLRGTDTLHSSVTTIASPHLKADNSIDTVGLIGIQQMASGYESLGLVTSIGEGFNTTNYFVGRTLVFVKQLVTMEVSFKMVGGPLFIAKQSGREARRGVSYLVMFMALLSVNLAVLNVLPIPVLDGGHLVFLAVEALKGKPISAKARLIAMNVGMLVLLALIVSVTYNDILRVITN